MQQFVVRILLNSILFVFFYPFLCEGNFTGTKVQEIAVAKGNSLELLGLDNNGKIHVICSSPAFAIIRSLVTFRLAGNVDSIFQLSFNLTVPLSLGASKDYVVIGSDSGKICIVEYDSQLKGWKIIHTEVFGRTGCRRTVPGQYLAADPKGRALLIGNKISIIL
jgi:splicing factor 3B subunit 3